ncbi:MAG: tyrosine-protein phosphatase [Bacteroidales bacterium]|nr:tyrosine-protein phosphatase [Bacteroidales bacterium]
MITISATTLLPFKGIQNARDLGGYTMKDGRNVREGRLLRAAHLADATDSDLNLLASLHIRKIIDFRKEEELRGKVDREIPGAEHIFLPLDASGNAMEQASEEEKKKFTTRKKFDVRKIIVPLSFNEKARKVAGEMYPTLLFSPECQKAYAAFFRMLLDTEDGAVLYHCTQGKDRTGIASALILAALGAYRETIVADFDATNRIYEADVRKYSRRVRFWGGGEPEVGVVKSFLGANTDNFVKALDRIDCEYGSMEAFLKGPVGLSDSDINILKQRYLV